MRKIYTKDREICIDPFPLGENRIVALKAFIPKLKAKNESLYGVFLVEMIGMRDGIKYTLTMEIDGVKADVYFGEVRSTKVSPCDTWDDFYDSSNEVEVAGLQNLGDTVLLIAFKGEKNIRQVPWDRKGFKRNPQYKMEIPGDSIIECFTIIHFNKFPYLIVGLANGFIRIYAVPYKLGGKLLEIYFLLTQWKKITHFLWFEKGQYLLVCYTDGANQKVGALSLNEKMLFSQDIDELEKLGKSISCGCKISKSACAIYDDQTGDIRILRYRAISDSLDQ